MLGACGALMGTRFYASDEALGSDRAKHRIAAATGDETERTGVFDIVRGLAWPPSYAGRALRNGFMKRWQGRESELAAAVATEFTVFQNAARAEDFETAMVWAGESVDLITAVEGAARIVARTTADAEARLRSAPLLTRFPPTDPRGTRIADGDAR